MTCREAIQLHTAIIGMIIGIGGVILLAMVVFGCTTMQPVAKPENSQNCQILGQDNIWRTCESLGRVF